ncbi:signal peptide peptidase SppA [Chitinophaga defluvii]|uniref:Signal peptide peptidase SppA n=1 Tax=Chitinophaga defluvii TaxID=3163343 RepID=A0ABV2T675_9BACT
MRSFFKIFFAMLLALIIFTIVGVVILLGIIGRSVTPEKVVIAPNGVLVLETSQLYPEQKVANPFGGLKIGPDETPGLYDAVRLIRYAATDDNIKGIYLKTSGNPNGYATNEEIRNALIAFRKAKKFIYAYGEGMSQSGYYMASVADKIYLNPKGGVDFGGFAVQLMFLKGTLEKLDIEPQIFYDGRFKSATEPLRETQMTAANRIQTSAFLDELYGNFLQKIGEIRQIDTAVLHGYANVGLIQEASDALQYKLADGLKYDDEVIDEIRRKLGLKPDDDVNFVSLKKYEKSANYNSGSADSKIALIYAQGSIVSGDSEGPDVISSGQYLKEIRKARLDKDVKAIVFRVNSGGGSALASEVIWRELLLAKKEKPVIVSMGDYAASGGYYISCMADSIFAQPNTLTGSIGVFAVMPNMQGFFKNKLGVTFDGVKTAQYADLGTASRPLTEIEKKFVQNSVDSIYASFKSRVATGRKLDPAIVDSIAQGRVWSGVQAKALGLVDRLGGVDDALACAAKMANLSTYSLNEYPEAQDVVTRFMKQLGGDASAVMIKKELGENYKIYQQIKNVQQMNGEVQARLPFDFQLK